MRHHFSRAAVAAASVIIAAIALAGCASGNGTEPTTSASPTQTLVPSPTPIATITPGATPTPSATAEATAEIPEDCRSLLTSAVLDQLEGVPLNDPAFDPTGSQPDGSLICRWGDPRADTTGLMTTISYMSRGPALDMLNELADDQDFTCYTPDDGTRCEKTWDNPTYPVTDGRPLFWRAGVMIDTVYSNLAPTGYTDAVIASIYD